MHGDLSNHPLASAVAAAVPLRIAEYEAAGGPTDADIGRVREFAWALGSRADVLLHRGGKPGESAALFAGLVDALAVLAYCPGGVTFAGDRYAAGPLNKGR